MDEMTTIPTDRDDLDELLSLPKYARIVADLVGDVDLHPVADIACKPVFGECCDKGNHVIALASEGSTDLLTGDGGTTQNRTGRVSGME